MSFWESVLPGGLGAYGYSQLLGDFKDQRRDIRSTIGGLQDYVSQQGQFQPYSLRGPMGQSSYGPEGLQMNLNAQQKGIQDQMFGGGQSLLNQSMMDRGQREQDIYQQMRAAQLPEEQRMQQAMQSTAYNQGRSGIRDQRFGGTQEQLAFEKARQEQMANTRLGAMDQARAENQDQYTRGLGMLNAGYKPMDSLMSQGAMGMDFGQLLGRPQENMMNLYANLGLGGLGSEVNMSNVMGNAFGNMIGAGQGMLGGLGGMIDSSSDSTNPLKDLLGIFGF